MSAIYASTLPKIINLNEDKHLCSQLLFNHQYHLNRLWIISNHKYYLINKHFQVKLRMNNLNLMKKCLCVKSVIQNILSLNFLASRVDTNFVNIVLKHTSKQISLMVKSLKFHACSMVVQLNSRKQMFKPSVHRISLRST